MFIKKNRFGCSFLRARSKLYIKFAYVLFIDLMQVIGVICFQAVEVDNFFHSLRRSYFCLHVAAYCFALHIAIMLETSSTAQQARVYCHPPSEVINHVMTCLTTELQNDWPEECTHLASLFLQYHRQMTDFAQGQELQKLGRGRSLP